MANAALYPRFENKPFATLGDLLTDRENLEAARVKNDIGRQSVVESQARVQESQQQAQDKATTAQRAEAQRALAQEAFQKFGRPDGSVNKKAIIAYVQPKDYELSQKLSTAFAKFQKDATDARKGELDNEDKQWSMIGQALQGVNASTYASVWSRINSIDPEMGQFLGPQFDPQKVQTALAMGTARRDWNAQTKDILDSDEANTTKALKLLANASDQEQASDALEFAKVHGVDDDLTQMGFGQWTPDTPQRAANFLMGPEKVATLAEQKADNERQASQFAANEAQQNRQFQASNAIAQGNLDVSRGNLKARQDEAKAGAGAAGGAKLSAAAIEKVAGVDQSLGMIADIDRMMPNMKGYIGPIDGRTASAVLATGVGVTPQLAEFDAQLTGLKNAVIKATTGAAMSEPEAKRIMGQLPSLNLPETVFKARLETTKRNLEMLKKRTIELSGGSDAPAASNGKVRVQGRDGKTYEFPNQALADGFKKDGG